MMCVVNFVFALSQLQGVEWEWPGRRETDAEHSPASQGRGDSFLFKFSFVPVLVPLYSIFLFVTQLPSVWSDELYFLFGVFLP